MLEGMTPRCHPKPTGWCPIGVGYSPQPLQDLPIHPHPSRKLEPGAIPALGSGSAAGWEGAQHSPITPGLGPPCPRPDLTSRRPSPAGCSRPGPAAGFLSPRGGGRGSAAPQVENVAAPTSSSCLPSERPRTKEPQQRRKSQNSSKTPTNGTGRGESGAGTGRARRGLGGR